MEPEFYFLFFMEIICFKYVLLTERPMISVIPHIILELTRHGNEANRRNTFNIP